MLPLARVAINLDYLRRSFISHLGGVKSLIASTVLAEFKVQSE